MNVPTPSAPQDNFDVGALYVGTYVKADDLNGQTYAATIAAVERVEIAEENGAVRPKAAVQLQNWPAKLLLNKTNFETIASAYGRHSSGWLGKPLEVYPDTTVFNGRSVSCVRVRVPRLAAPVAAVPGVGLPVAPATTPTSSPAPPRAAEAAPSAPGPPPFVSEAAGDIPY
jgi:hypothetical protein